ncbi:hypothetical protein HMI55_006157 [Coelomomyces lativittatus]|nr:hypothetical protein HMI55_006157 [Coelomomyces lativittatus]
MKTMTTPISTEENLDDEFYDQLLNDLTTSTTPLSSTVPLLNKTSLEHTPPSPPLDDSNSNPLDKQTNEAAVDDTKFDTFAQEFALEMEALITKLDLPTAETPCSSTLNTHPSHSFQTRVQQTMEQLKSSTSNFETNHPLDEGLEVDPDAKLEELFKNLTSHLQQGLVDESTTEAFSNDLMNSLLSKEN